jgi:hypothetical protein
MQSGCDFGFLPASKVEQQDWASAAKKPSSLGELAFANDMRAKGACLAKRRCRT